MYETAIPMGKMLNAFLAIHGRCKFIIFLRGQTPSLSAPTLILSLMEHFQGKAKNTLKHSIKSTFSISIQLNCNWLPGNPQLPPYIYIHTHAISKLGSSKLLPTMLGVRFSVHHKSVHFGERKPMPASSEASSICLTNCSNISVSTGS